MAKADSKNVAPAPAQSERYDEVVGRLEAVVKKLETGELSLEDSLKAFEEGIGLVRRGERLLVDAEQRIEQLLTQDGELKAVPLEGTTPPRAATAPASRAPVREPPPREDDDIPF